MKYSKKSWMDVTINQFKDIKEILLLDSNDLDKSIQIIALLNNVDVDDIESLPIVDLNNLIKSIEFISQPITTINVPNTLLINGVLFSVNKNISTLTVSQYLNLIEYSKDFNANLHNILSIFIRPCMVTKSVLGKNSITLLPVDDSENADYLLNNMSIVYANGLMLFFSEVYRTLINYILRGMKMTMSRLTLRMKVRRMLGLAPNQVLLDGLDALMLFQKKLEEVGMLSMK